MEVSNLRVRPRWLIWDTSGWRCGDIFWRCRQHFPLITTNMADENGEGDRSEGVGPPVNHNGSAGPSAGANAVMTNFGMPWYFGSQFISKFSGEKGTTRFSQWILQVEAFLRAQVLQPQQGVDFLLSALDGQAHREAVLLPPIKRDSAQALIKALVEKYGDNRSPDTLQEQFFSCRQTENEGSEEFALRLRERLHQWHTSDPDRIGGEDKRLRAQFSKGLREGAIKRELQRHLRRTPQATFEDIRREARSIEKEEQSAMGEVAACQAQVTPALPPLKSDTVPQSSLQQLKDSLRAELQQDLREQVVLLGKTIAEELRGQLQTPGRNPEPTLRWTGPPNAPANRPPTRQRQRLDHQEPRGYRWDEQGRPVCRDCGEAGHIQRFCPHRPTPPQGFCPARSLQGE